MLAMPPRSPSTLSRKSCGLPHSPLDLGDQRELPAGLTPVIGVNTSALTRTNDTNVTLTLGGSPTTSLLAAVSLTLGWSGQLSAPRGGTGQSSYTVGDLLYADTTTSLAKLPDVATGNALISGGVGVAPTYGKIDLTTHISGILPYANQTASVRSNQVLTWLSM